ncbi:MAG: hypothetical protein ABIG29_03120 [Candidatus Nealsonbacteria bacterium]
MGNIIVIVDKQQLTPANPTVGSLANRFGWRPETVLARIQRSLPAVLEQRMYLVVSEDWPLGMRPETFNMVLRVLISNQNIPRDRVDEVGRKLERVCTVFDICKDNDVSISWKTAAQLALAYGIDVESVVELVIGESFLIVERLGLRINETAAAGIFLREIARHCAGEGKRGIPNILTSRDVIILLKSFPNPEGYKIIEGEVEASE